MRKITKRPAFAMVGMILFGGAALVPHPGNAITYSDCDPARLALTDDGPGGSSDPLQCSDLINGNDGDGSSGGPDDVNTVGGGLFGFTDWTLVAKDDDLDGTDFGSLSSLTISNVTLDDDDEPIAGDWAIDDASYGVYMIVFKAATDFFGGALIASPASGTFDNPLNNGKALSHVSLYGRGDPSIIPVPAGVLLIGTALVGAGAFRRLSARRS